MKFLNQAIFLTVIATGSIAQADEEIVQSWIEALTIPDAITANLNRRYQIAAPGGVICFVTVDEQLIAHEPIPGENAIIFPYQCQRTNHWHRCGASRRFRSSTAQASYTGKVVAEYEIVDGLLKFPNYQNPNDTNESECGQLIIDYLISISIN